jgi:hypothetical protein
MLPAHEEFYVLTAVVIKNSVLGEIVHPVCYLLQSAIFPGLSFDPEDPHMYLLFNIVPPELLVYDSSY